MGYKFVLFKNGKPYIDWAKVKQHSFENHYAHVLNVYYEQFRSKTPSDVKICCEITSNNGYFLTVMTNGQQIVTIKVNEKDDEQLQVIVLGLKELGHIMHAFDSWRRAEGYEDDSILDLFFEPREDDK